MKSHGRVILEAVNQAGGAACASSHVSLLLLCVSAPSTALENEVQKMRSLREEQTTPALSPRIGNQLSRALGAVLQQSGLINQIGRKIFSVLGRSRGIVTIYAKQSHECGNARIVKLSFFCQFRR